MKLQRNIQNSFQDCLAEIRETRAFIYQLLSSIPLWDEIPLGKLTSWHLQMPLGRVWKDMHVIACCPSGVSLRSYRTICHTCGRNPTGPILGVSAARWLTSLLILVSQQLNLKDSFMSVVFMQLVEMQQFFSIIFSANCVIFISGTKWF